MPPIRVVIADDHAVFRQGLTSLLGEVEGISVVGHAADADEAIERAAELDPDVLLMDLTMPGGGLHATSIITEHSPRTGILVLTMHRDEVHVAKAIRAGARGYLLKDAEATEIVRAIEAVAAGQTIFDPGVSATVLGAPRLTDHPFPALTARERDVLAHLTAGLGTEAIAGRLGISTKTVQNNVSQILLKLGARDRIHAVALARDAGVP